MKLAQEITDLILSGLDISVPIKITFGGGSFANYRERIIHLSRTADEGVLLHEIAHILQRHTYGYGYTPHGKEFRTCLLKVVELWYNSLEPYDWNSEYPSIKKWYYREIKK